MNIPEDLKYAKTHEWVRTLENGITEIGISDYAQKELGDIVFVNLPKAGDKLSAGGVFADIESVKAVSDIISPLSGTVSEVNAALADTPGLINSSPYTAWLIRAESSSAEGSSADAALLSAEEYKKTL